MTTPRSRPRTCLLALAAASSLAVALIAPAVHAASSAPATKCDISKVATSLGPTEVTSLKVTNVTCANAVKVVKAFHACRLEHGASGRCVKLVKGYACGEQRYNAGPQFTSKTTCRKNGKTVVHNYTQVV